MLSVINSVSFALFLILLSHPVRYRFGDQILRATEQISNEEVGLASLVEKGQRAVQVRKRVHRRKIEVQRLLFYSELKKSVGFAYENSLLYNRIRRAIKTTSYWLEVIADYG